MSCEAMPERLTARLGGELGAGELQELEAHLAVCAHCAAEAKIVEELWRGLALPREEVPSARMRARFDAMLASELRPAPPAPLLFTERPQPQPLTPSARETSQSDGFGRRFLALAAMLLVGLGLGYLTFGRPGDGVADLNSHDVADLKREVGDLHEMVALSLLERGSVSERLQGVSYGREYSAGDERGDQGQRVIAALFARLLEDPNVNVRLAALEALRPMATRDDRRSQLVAAVARQDSPLVALSLIDLLLESGSTAARRDLEQLLVNPKLDPAVRGYLRDRLGRSA